MDSTWRPWYAGRRWHALAVFVSGVCLIALMYHAYAIVFTTPDLQVWWPAARLWLSGVDPYGATGDRLPGTGSGFAYPFPAVLICVPLALLPLAGASTVSTSGGGRPYDVSAHAFEAIIHLLRRDPGHVVNVVTAARREEPPRRDWLSGFAIAQPDDCCATITFARSGFGHPPEPLPVLARAFFAAVSPDVWRRLPKTTQQAWVSVLDDQSAVLSVSSLGAEPDVLERAPLNNDLVVAVFSHRGQRER